MWRRSAHSSQSLMAFEITSARSMGVRQPELVEKADLLKLTAPEMTVVGGLRALGVSHSDATSGLPSAPAHYFKFLYQSIGYEG